MCSGSYAVDDHYLLCKVDDLRSIDNYCVVVKKCKEFCKEDVSKREPT